MYRKSSEINKESGNSRGSTKISGTSETQCIRETTKTRKNTSIRKINTASEKTNKSEKQKHRENQNKSENREKREKSNKSETQRPSGTQRLRGNNRNKRQKQDKDPNENNPNQRLQNKTSKQTDKDFIEILHWNCNNLRPDKFTDIELQYFSNISEMNNAVVCLTETHHKGKILNFKKDMTGLGTFRKKIKRRKRRGIKNTENKDEEEKEGGGIQVLFPKSEKFELKKIKNSNSEILDIEGKMHGIDMKLVVTYFDVDKGKRGRDNNKKIRKDLEKIIESNEKEGLILTGDFNGHLRMIDGKPDDVNGKMLIEWVEKYGLIILNLDEKCEGKYTRIQKVKKN